MNSPCHAVLPHAFFLSTDSGQRFCLFHAPQGKALRGCMLYLHPFAEELNSTRRMVAQQARALAQNGYGVLQIDLLGCGDSEGSFADATWELWLQDAQVALQWLRANASGPLWLWGMRGGALLAAELANTLHEPAHLLLWQPVVSGRQQLQQFLRLHAAGQWLESGNAKKDNPAQMLAQGRTVDIAGYTLTPALAQGLGNARLQPSVSQPPGRLVRLDLSLQAEPVLSPASEAQVTTWRQAGWQVDASILTGPAFWQNTGMEEAPDLIHATLHAVASVASVTQLAPVP